MQPTITRDKTPYQFSWSKMIKKIFLYLPLAVLILVGLYFVFTTSPSVRYWVDDFCSAVYLRNKGFFGAQIGWWKGWTGRYSAMAFTDFFELLGPWVARVLPVLLLFFLILSATPVFFSNVIFASLFVFLILINSPNIIQTFYWQTGTLNYTTPFIFLNLFLAILVSKKGRMWLFLSFVLMFIAGGFSEAFALAAITLSVFVIFVILTINPKGKKAKLEIAIAGTVGVIVSFVFMLFSPGNAARGLTMRGPDTLLFIIKSTILGTKWYLLRMLSIKSFLYSLLVILFSVSLFSTKIKLSSKRSLMLMAGSVITAFLATAAVIGSGYYAMLIIPPERTLFIAVTMMFFCFFVFSFSLRSILRKVTVRYQKSFFWATISLNFFAVVLLVQSMIPHWVAVRAEIQDYAVAFDKLEPLLIESAGVKDISINNIKPVGKLDSFTDNKGWVLGCVAKYYNLKSVKIAK
jgi:hypothetical protein